MLQFVTRALVLAIVCTQILGGTAAPTDAKSPMGAVASYDFSNGQPLADRTGHGYTASIHGDVRMIKRAGASFDGNGRLSIPLSKPLLGEDATIIVRARGHGASLRQITKEEAGRGPEFQICGSTLEYAFNTDKLVAGGFPDNRRMKDAEIRAKIAMELHTGAINLDTGARTDAIRVASPRAGLEPMLQFVHDKVYYEYFATTTKTGPWEIYTASARADQRGWSTIQRTNEKHGYRVEFGNLQVVGNRIYYGFPERDARNLYQTWTASSAIDGSQWHAQRRTPAGGWFPVFQVVGSKVYLVFAIGASSTSLKADATLAVASMNTDGSGWKILRKIGHEDIARPFALMRVDKGIIYVSYTERAKPGGTTYLRIARMHVDGTGFQSFQRTFGIENGQPAYLDVVGNRMYFVYWQTPSSTWPSQRVQKHHYSVDPWEYWFASSKLDGSDWHAHRLFPSRSDLGPFYKGIQVIGGRTYLGVQRIGKNAYSSNFVAAEGSNLINRGGLYGIGVTNDRRVLAFVDSGQEYLCRGEAPDSTSGTIAEAATDSSAWHTYAAVFSHGMVRLYIDGKLESVQRGDAIREGNVSYPLEIGDGFVGNVSTVKIYRRALSAQEIASSRA